ncbi:MAG: Asp23/Gls24 family envelope stress response protein [Pseudoflavonifractor sp.]
MSENRDYVSRPDEMGNIHISEEVLAVIAAAAALEVEGVGSLSPNLGNDIVEMLGGKKNIAKGVRVSMNEDDSINVDVAVLIKYGYTILDVAKQVQNGVFSAIENMSGLTPACVNVSVGGITFEKDAKRPQQ